MEMPNKGVRLRNSTGVDCFINTAVNIMASNKVIRRAIFNDKGPGNRDEHSSGMNTENTHGIGVNRAECPETSKEAIASHGVHFLVAQELKRLMSLNGNPGDTVILRKLLGQLFGLFRETRQNDAGDAFFPFWNVYPKSKKCFLFHFDSSGLAFLAIARK